LTIEDPRYFKSLKGLIKNDSNVFIKIMVILKRVYYINYTQILSF